MQELSILDFAVISRELQSFVGGTVNKIWQQEDDRELEIEFFNQDVGRKRVVFQPGRVFTTEESRDHPMKPPNFCMFLRKHLGRAQITAVEQKQLDRILHISFSNGMTLILELFGNGNVILVNEEGNIEAALEQRSWKTRDIFKGEPYKPPNTTGNKQFFTADGLEQTLNENEIVSILAQTLGGLYAEEALHRASIDPDTPGTELSPDQQKTLVAVLQELLQHCQSAVEGHVYYTDEGEPVAVAATPLTTYDDHTSTEHGSLLAAVNHYITEYKQFHKLQAQQQEYEEQLGKLQRRKEQQEQQIEDMEEEAETLQELGDALYEDYSLVQELLTTLRQARKQMNESDVKQRLEQEQAQNIPEAQLVENLDFARGTVTLDLGPGTATLDLDKSVEENAETLYEEAKHARQKIDGAQDALKETEEALREHREQTLAGVDTGEEIEKETREPEWFEQYRWFYSSQNVLVLAGRDADQNEEIVKTRADDGTVLFHAEIQGSPFTVIPGARPENTKKETLEEAAAFTAAMSSAWRKQLGSVDVYQFTGRQAVKVSGLPKGAFQIQGDRTYYRDITLEIGVGVHQNRPMTGPVSAVKQHCDRYIVLEPGSTAKEDVAEELQAFFAEDGYEFDVEALIHVLPPGNCHVTEKVATR